MRLTYAQKATLENTVIHILSFNRGLSRLAISSKLNSTPLLLPILGSPSFEELDRYLKSALQRLRKADRIQYHGTFGWQLSPSETRRYGRRVDIRGMDPSDACEIASQLAFDPPENSSKVSGERG